MENYEEKYKLALNRIKVLIANVESGSKDCISIDDIQEVYPELAESEDERMKEAIIATIHLYYGEPLEDKAKEMIAWLEKQGEQKPDTDFYDLRTWKYIVDAAWTEKEGIGQYLDSPFTEEVAKKLQNRFGNIKQDQKDEEESIKESKLKNSSNGPEFSKAINNLRIAVGCLAAWKGEPKHTSEDGRLMISEDILELLISANRTLQESDIFDWDQAYRKGLDHGVIRGKNAIIAEQKPAEWNEEDEQTFIESVEALEDFGKFELADWLKEHKNKFLSSQSHWKPSDMELEVLRLAAEKDGTCLMGLYEQLKKLREE